MHTRTTARITQFSLLIAAVCVAFIVSVPLTAFAAPPASCVSSGEVVARLTTTQTGYVCTFTPLGVEGENNAAAWQITYDQDGKQTGQAQPLQTGTEPEQNGNARDALTCSFTKPSAWLQQCIWIPLTSVLGTAFIAAGAALLDMSSWLFNVLVKWIIVDFGGTLATFGLDEGIAKGWTALRDFANILIIGIFVFIAICIILGVKEYGQKKLIANVLIVAMLLNFSLLFTKLVIDASNFTAYQIYRAVSGTSSSGDFSVADSFMKAMRVTSIGDSYAVVERAAKEVNSGWYGLFYGFIVFLVLSAAALVLFYGVFIIAARGILLIFLMLVAGIAFATYLIPGLAQSEYGFHKWWKTLLNAAIFAPLLMLFLAISLFVVQTATNSTTARNSNVTLGAIAADPSTLAQSGAWATLWIYIIGLALLFLSIRFSSKFAGSISGMGYVPGLFKTALAAPFALTAGRVVAPLMQRTLGKGAFARAGALTSAARAANLDSGLAINAANRYSAESARRARAGDHVGAFDAAQNAAAQRQLSLDKQSEAQKLLERAAKAKVKADKTYNIMDTGMAKAVNKALGNALTGESAKGGKGYATRVEEKGKVIAKLAEGARPGDAEKTTINERAQRAAEQMHEDQAITRRQAHQDAIVRQRDAQEAAAGQREAISRVTEAIRAEQNRVAEDIRTAKAQKTALVNNHAEAERALIARIGAAADEGERVRLRGELQDLQQLNALDQKQKDNDIATKEAEMERLTRRQNDEVTVPLAELGRNLDRLAGDVAQADRSLKALPGEINESAKTLAKLYNNAANDAVGDLAAGIGQQEGGTHVADAARSALKKQRGNAQRLKELLKDEEITGSDNSGEAGGTPTT